MSKLSDAEELKINLDGQALERAGRIEDAIVRYEYGVTNGTRTPGTFRRLLVLYRKLGRTVDERRICELAASRWPGARDGYGNVSPSDFSVRLARLARQKAR